MCCLSYCVQNATSRRVCPWRDDLEPERLEFGNQNAQQSWDLIFSFLCSNPSRIFSTKGSILGAKRVNLGKKNPHELNLKAHKVHEDPSWQLIQTPIFWVQEETPAQLHTNHLRLKCVLHSANNLRVPPLKIKAFKLSSVRHRSSLKVVGQSIIRVSLIRQVSSLLHSCRQNLTEWARFHLKSLSLQKPKKSYALCISRSALRVVDSTENLKGRGNYDFFWKRVIQGVRSPRPHKC